MILLRRIGFSLGAIVVLIAFLIWSLPVTLPLGLRLAGIDDVRFGAIDVGFRGASIEALSIGDPPRQSVATIEAGYSFKSLLNGRLDRLHIDGLIVEAAFRDGMFSLGDAEEDSEAAREGASDLPGPLAAERLSIAKSRINIETPHGLVSLPFSGEVALADNRLQFDLDIPSATLETERAGILKAALQLSGQLPLAGTPGIEQVTASGRLDIDGNDIWFDRDDDQAAISATIDLDFADGRLTIKGPLEVSGTESDADGRLKAAIAFDEHWQPASIADGEIIVDVNRLDGEALKLDRAHAALGFDGPLDDLKGSLTFDIEGLTASFGDVEVQRIKGSRSLDLALQGKRLEVTARDAGKKFSIDGVTLYDGGEEVLATGWFTIPWPEREAPWLRLNLEDGDFETDLALVIDPMRIETGSNRLWARIEDLTMRLKGDADGLKGGSIRIRRGRTDLPSANLALTGIESDFLLNDQGLDPSEPILLQVRALRPIDEPRPFSPLRLDAEITREPDRLDVEGQIKLAAKPEASLDFWGEHNIEAGRGEVGFKLPSLAFNNGQVQPGDVSPILDGVLSDAVGEIALDGEIAWNDGEIKSDLSLLIRELGFTIGPARLSRINSVISFDSLAPPTTPPEQLLSIGLLDVGLPLTDGLVSMQLRPDGQLAIDQLTWRLADGDIRAAPFTFGSDVKDLTMKLTAEQLDLNALLRLTPLDELTGEGRIDGTLPLRIGETAAIKGGELAASRPGVIRYAPSAVPGILQAGGESVSLMLQALENFQYDALKLTLDGKTDGNTTIGLHLKGANPELYDGHPVEFNLNLDGNLASLIQTNLDNYQIPDRIRERLQGFER